MPEVHVTTNSLVVFGMVGLLGAAAVLAFIVAFRVRVPDVPDADEATDPPAAPEPTPTTVAPTTKALPQMAVPWSTVPPSPELDEPTRR